MARSSSQLLHPSYRPDVDGLRAIAVLAVVGFHAAPGRVAGGFIGVDVFFVISGYLISTIIFSNLERTNNFSIIDFYNRRIRRIFPSLITIMIASLAFGWFALTADEYTQLGKHIGGGAAFVSNLLLYRESGYFDTAADMKPMLHLWSLAIEEQFYIFWPLMLAFAWKRKWSFLRATAAIGILSFLVNLYLVHRDPSAAFYWPISRFWELMIGGVLAYLTLHRPELLRRGKNAQSLLGFALLALGLLFINRARGFPSWWALLPAMSSFFVISAGPQAWFNKHVLSKRVLVWIGLISYPLYLWHWPLLSFARTVQSGEVSARLRIAIICLSVLASWITYQFIELPFRQQQYKYGKMALLVAVMVVVGCSGAFCFISGGLKSRGPKMMNAGDIGNEGFQKKFNRYPPCSFATSNLSDSDRAAVAECRQSIAGKGIELAVLGDSHSRPFFVALADSFAGVNVGVFPADAIPFVDNKEFETAFKYVLNDNGIHTVVLIAHWSGRLKPNSQVQLRDELEKTVEVLESYNKSVVITNDNPDFSFGPDRCKYEGRLGQANLCTQDIRLLYSQLATYEPVFESVATKHPRLKVLHTAELFCKNDSCSMEDAGLLLFQDYQHLNINGAEFLGKQIQQEYSLASFRLSSSTAQPSDH